MEDEAGTQFKSIYDIMVGIGETWDTLKDVDQAALLEALAGKRQANALAATLQNVDMLKNAYETAENSAGSAAKAQENYTRSIQYSLDVFKATGQETLMNVIGSDFLKGAIDAGTNLINVLDKILGLTGMIGPAMAASFAFFSRRSGAGLLNYDKSTRAFTGLVPAINSGLKSRKEWVDSNKGKTGKEYRSGAHAAFLGGFSKGGNEAAYNIRSAMSEELISKPAEYISDAESLKKSYAIVAEKTGQSVKNVQRLTQDVIATSNSAGQAAIRFSQINEETSGFGQRLKGGLASLGGNLFNMAAMMAISVGIELISNAISEVTITAEEASDTVNTLVDDYKQLKDTTKENIKTTKGLQDRWFKLREGVVKATNANLSLTPDDYDEYLSITNQIADMFPTLVSGYDAEGNAIISTTNALKDLTNAYNESGKAAARAILEGEKEDQGKTFQVFMQDYLNKTSQTQAQNNAAGVFSRLWGKLTKTGHGIIGKYDIGTDTTADSAIKSMEMLLQNREEFLRKWTEESAHTGDEYVISQKELGKSYGEIAGMEYVQAWNDIKGLFNYSDDELKEIINDSTKFNDLASDIRSKMQDINIGITDAASDMQTLIQAAAEYNDEFYNLSDSEQTMVGSIISSLSRESIEGIVGTDKDHYADQAKSFANNLISKLQSTPALVNNFESITEALGDTSSLSSDQLANVGKMINSIADAIDNVSRSDLQGAFGYDELQKVQTAYEHFSNQLDVSSKSSQKAKEELDKLSVADKQVFVSMMTARGGITNATDALNAYKNAAIAARIEEGKVGKHNFQTDIEEGTTYNAAEATQASDFKDLGATYDSMASMFEEAEKLYHRGNTGTGEFKNIAAMFDAYGRTDIEAFAKNREKIASYFKTDTDEDGTQTNTGMLNFLNDLSELNNEAGNKMAVLNEKTGKWALNLDNLEENAKTAGIGFETFLAILDKLEAKGFILEYFNSKEEGYQRIGETYADYIAESAKLTAMQGDGSGRFSTDEIDAQKQKVKELKDAWETAKKAVDNYTETTNYDLQEETLINTADEAAKTANKILNGKDSEVNKNTLLAERNVIQDQINTLRRTEGEDFNIDDKKFEGLKEDIATCEEALDAMFGPENEYHFSFDDDLDELDIEPDVETSNMTVTSDNVEIYGNSDKDSIAAKDNHDVLHGIKDEGEVEITPTLKDTGKAIKKQLKDAADGAKGKVDLDISDAQDKADTFKQTLKDAQKTAQEAVRIDIDANDNVSPVVDAVQEHLNIINQSDPVQLDADSSNADAAIQKTQYGVDSLPLSTIININANVTGLSLVDVLKTAINNLKSKTITLKVRRETETDSGSGYTGTIGGFFGGTLSSFARGSKVSVDRNMNAVVNELGEEGLIRDGVLHRISGGMQQIKLKRGDIVVNHKQMQELEDGEVKSNGGRGRLIGSFVRGTLDGVHAFGGLDAEGVIKTDGKTTTKKKGDNATDNDAKATERHTDATNESTKSFEKLQKEWEKLYDWIEVFLEREDRILERYETKSELRLGKLTKSQKKTVNNAENKAVLREAYQANNPLDKAYSRTVSDLKSSKKSAARYKQQANSVKLNTKDSEADKRLKKAVRNGRVADIQKYGEETQARIEEYKKWWDKYLEVQDKQLEWQQKLKDLEQQRLDNIEDFYNARVDYQSSVQDINEAERSRLTAGKVGKAGSNPLSKAYKNTITSDVKSQEKQTTLLKAEEKRYKAEMKKAKKRFGKNSKEYKEAETAHNSIIANLKESQAKEVQLQKDYEDERLQYIEDHYNTLKGVQEARASKWEANAEYIIANNGSEYNAVRSKAYQKANRQMLDVRNKEVEKAKQYMDDMASELKKAQKVYGKNSDEYKKALTTSKNADAEYYSALTAKLKEEQSQRQEYISSLISYYDALIEIESARADYSQVRRDYSKERNAASVMSDAYEEYVVEQLKYLRAESTNKVKEANELLLANWGDVGSDEYKKNQEDWLKARNEAIKAETDVLKAEKEYEEERLSYIRNHYETILSGYSSLQGIGKAQQGYIQTAGLSRSDGTYVQKILDQYNQQILSTQALQEEAATLSEELERVRSVYGASSDDYKAVQNELNNLKAEIINSQTSEVELKKAILENTRYLKEIQTKVYDRILQRLQAAGNYYASRPDDASTMNTNAVWIATESALADTKKIDKLQREIATLRSQMSKYDETSEDFQSLADEVNSKLIEVLSTGADIFNQMDVIFQTYKNQFERDVNQYLTSVSDMQHILGLINEDAYVDKSGKITEQGNAAIALTASMINDSKNAMEAYRVAIDEVRKAREKELISENDANDLILEYTQNIQNEVSQIDDLKESILSIYKTQLETENDLLQENIQKRKEALQAKEDYYNYDKTLKKTNKDIQKLQAQIAALSGTSSAYGKARMLQLQEELADLEDTKSDTLRQHRNDLISSGYDQLAKDAEETLDDTLRALQVNTAFQEDVVTTMLLNMGADYQNTYDTINGIITNNSTVISQTTAVSIDKFKTLEGAVSAVGTAVVNVRTDCNSLKDVSTAKAVQRFVELCGQMDTTDASAVSIYTDADNINNLNFATALTTISQLGNAFSGVTTEIGNMKSAWEDAITAMDAAKSSAENAISVSDSISSDSNSITNGGTGDGLLIVESLSSYSQHSSTKPAGMNSEETPSVASSLLNEETPSVTSSLLNEQDKNIAALQATATEKLLSQKTSTTTTSNTSSQSNSTKSITSSLGSIVDFAKNASNVYNAQKAKTTFTDAEIKAAGWNTPGKAVKVGSVTGHISKKGNVFFNTTGKNGVVKRWNPKTGEIYTYPYSEKTYKEHADSSKYPNVYYDFKNVLHARGVKGYSSGGTIRNIIPLKNLANGDDGLITAQLGEAVLPKTFMADVVPDFMKSIKDAQRLITPISKSNDVSVYYDSLLTVNGNVDRDALPGLKQLLQQSYEYTSKQMTKDLRKIGLAF